MSGEQAIDDIISYFEKRGDGAYFGEPVTQTQHALQAAQLATEENAPDTLIAAALLHDIGHLLPGQDEGMADAGRDGRHEDAGDAYLVRWFSPAVTEPVRLHVAAKRYLCAVDPAYYDALSDASKKSLALQGGPMSPEEVREFETNPHFADAVRLRRWDDAAKIEDWNVPGVATYRNLLTELVAGR